MYKHNILIKVTGSIAAYKAAYLTSKLTQNNFDVRVAMSSAALKFIGAATFEGLTGGEVYADTFEPGKIMSHIDLAKWADLTIVAPASANTINKLAAGIADNLITSLFLARDNYKPYLIAPAMNVNMLEHPATQESIKKLTDWGIKILPTDYGTLACGDKGTGKLLSPDEIYNYILSELRRSSGKKVLITSGGTVENIDGVRYVSNMSTGKTGSKLADEFYIQDYDVDFLYAENSAVPETPVNKISYKSFGELKSKLYELLEEKDYDLVIHLSAVSDYSPVELKVGEKTFEIPLDNKLRSDEKEISVKFSKNEKLVDKIKEHSKNKNVKLVSFKLLEYEEQGRAEMEISKLFSHSHSDMVVFNSLNNRPNNTQKNFSIYTPNGKRILSETSKELANEIILNLLETA